MEKERDQYVCKLLQREGFVQILISKERMILCREKDFLQLKKWEIKKIICTGFPELLKGKSFLEKLFFRPPYRLVKNKMMYRSIFDRQVDFLERGHNWERKPFMALRTTEKNFCQVRAIILKEKTCKGERG